MSSCPKHSKTHFYQCPKCGDKLCRDCTEQRDIGTTTLKSCPACGVGISPLPPKEIPFVQVAIEIVRQPFQEWNEFLILLMGALFCTAIEWFMAMNVFFLLNLALWFVLPGIVASFLGSTIRHTAQGHIGVPTNTDFVSVYDDLVLPALLSILATVAAFWPLILNLTGAAWFGPVLLPLLAITIPYAVICGPMAFGLAYFSGSIRQAINPVMVIRFIATIPGSYFATFLTLIIYGAVAGIVELIFIFKAVSATQNGFVLMFIIWLFRFIGGYLTMAILGRMIYDNQTDLGLRTGQVAQASKRPLIPANPAAPSPFHENSHPQGEHNSPLSPNHIPPNQRNISLDVSPLGGIAVGITDVATPPKDSPVHHNKQMIDLAPHDDVSGRQYNPKIDVESELPPIELPDPLGHVPAGNTVPFTDEERHPLSILPDLELPRHLHPEMDLESTVPEPVTSSEVKPANRQAVPVDPTTPIPAVPPMHSLPPPPTELGKKYLAQVAKMPLSVLPPKQQWAVASYFERSGKIREAIEAYQKMGQLNIDHPKAPDGLIRAVILTLKHYKNTKIANKLLNHLLVRYPHSNQIENAKKIQKRIS